MNANMTVNDGTNSRTYVSRGGLYRQKPNVLVHERKTAEYDDTPETLTTQFTIDGKLHIPKLILVKTKKDAVTGKVHVMKTVTTHIAEPGIWTQTESDNQLKEQGVILTTAGVATDMNQGAI